MSSLLTSAETLEPVSFRNVDEQEVPPCGVMRITGAVVEAGTTVLTCAQPSALLTAEYAVNGLVRVAPGGRGICYRRGDVSVAFDSGLPAAGEVWGVRAGQWTISRGYPGIVSVHGLRDAANQILTGRLHAPQSIVGTPATDVAAAAGGVPGSGSMVVMAWNGAAFVVATPAMVFVGYNAASAPLRAGTLAQFVEADGLWVTGGGAADPTTAIVVVDAGAANEANCLWPGKVASVSGTPADACANPFTPGADCWLLVLNGDGGSWAGAALTLTVGEHYLGRKVFEIEGLGVYAIRHDAGVGGVRMFKGHLSATLLRGDSSGSVSGLVALDGGDVPAISTASNPLHLAGLNGDDCYVVENLSGEEPAYEFLNIEHHDCS